MVNERQNILLIDDDETQLLIAKSLLQNEYTVFTAKSGKDAIENILQGFNPDIILLDILMPKMDGWETFNRIRSICLLKDVPIIFLTSVTEESQEKLALEMGAVDYIKKPYNNEDLLNRIKNSLRSTVYA
jgi:DNA-binding response OmpR family regulator